jgi:2-keto-4-pentenoate hydratase/2-oxohepta-3-ene-1,7-dioic acid hydratase in catechol pathway
MKLLSFIRDDGSKSYGIYNDQGIIDLGLRLGDKFKDIKALLTGNSLALVYQHINAAIDYLPEDVTFLPIIESPGKILCVGMNYLAKRQEFSETNNAPTLFVRI